MIITYSDGRKVEAALVARTGETIRVAIEGADDVTEFHRINGSWVSEHREPARIEFAWQHSPRKPSVSEADCCWSTDQAARLMQRVITGSEDFSDLLSPAHEALEATEALVMGLRAAAAVN